MLRYLTYKLKTQTLNESDSYEAKNDDDHDSGTESDDEGADAEELESYMGGDSSQQDASSAPPSDRASSTLETITDTTTEGRNSDDRQHLSGASKTDVESPLPDQALDSALPSDSDHNFDHHSSEEELEVINCRSRNSSSRHHHHHHRQRDKQQQTQSASSNNSQQYPEKRKWSQVNQRLCLTSDCCNNSGSSDEEVRDLMCVSAPVEFRSSPPANVPKPSRSLSPPPKLFHHAPSAHIPPHELCSVSPRKRHRRNVHHRNNHESAANTSSTNVQRPSLDFEKMQQEMTE